MCFSRFQSEIHASFRESDPGRLQVVGTRVYFAGESPWKGLQELTGGGFQLLWTNQEAIRDNLKLAEVSGKPGFPRPWKLWKHPSAWRVSRNPNWDQLQSEDGITQGSNAQMVS
jgi:hypothetical protein